MDALEGIESSLEGELPRDVYFQLAVDAKALRQIPRREHATIRNALTDWVRSQIRTFDYSEYGRDHASDIPPGVPFQVSLVGARFVGKLAGKLRIARFAPADLEPQRDERVRDALNRKLPKLQAWADKGARTILVLENDDVALSNVVVIYESLQRSGYPTAQLPYTIFLVDAMTTRWNVWTLKDGSAFPPRTRTGSVLWTEVDAQHLTDITA